MKKLNCEPRAPFLLLLACRSARRRSAVQLQSHPSRSGAILHSTQFAQSDFRKPISFGSASGGKRFADANLEPGRGSEPRLIL